ncbi:hypothetical protein EYW47_16200 [Paraburkholderia silviterrae]|uniref:Uncharacterized protein n=1 Tax=Paraburkholderia silviterrae TaxID=2528715 RepID=A0A4R5M8E7_9BURK|nr:hypothetical protein EYW47_16200 [Paraburkholderia silviterrae]
MVFTDVSCRSGVSALALTPVPCKAVDPELALELSAGVSASALTPAPCRALTPVACKAVRYRGILQRRPPPGPVSSNGFPRDAVVLADRLDIGRTARVDNKYAALPPPIETCVRDRFVYRIVNQLPHRALDQRRARLRQKQPDHNELAGRIVASKECIRVVEAALEITEQGVSSRCETLMDSLCELRKIDHPPDHRRRFEDEMRHGVPSFHVTVCRA